MDSSNHFTRASLTAALLLAGSLSARVCAAAPTVPERETARQAMDLGDRLFDEKEYDKALRAYREADAIMHVPTTGIEVAKTQAALGLLLDARETATAVAHLPVVEGEPAPFADARESAQRMAAALLARIPTIQLTLSGLPDGVAARVDIDGENVPNSVLVAPRKVNPGTHVLHGTAPGYLDVRRDVVVREKEHVTSELAMSPGQGSADHHPWPLLAYAGFGAGIGGVALGAITGLVSLGKTSSARSLCVGNACPASAQSEVSSAQTFATASDVFFGLGLASASVGLIAVLASGPRTEARSTTGMRVLIGPGSLELRGAF